MTKLSEQLAEDSGGQWDEATQKQERAIEDEVYGLNYTSLNEC